MTMDDRKYMRTLQDKVVAKLIKDGYADEDRIGDYARPDGYLITVKDLKQYVFPVFKSEFERFLAE